MIDEYTRKGYTKFRSSANLYIAINASSRPLLFRNLTFTISNYSGAVVRYASRLSSVSYIGLLRLLNPRKVFLMRKLRQLYRGVGIKNFAHRVFLLLRSWVIWAIPSGRCHIPPGASLRSRIVNLFSFPFQMCQTPSHCVHVFLFKPRHRFVKTMDQDIGRGNATSLRN